LLTFGNQDSQIQNELIQQQRSTIELQILSENKNLTFLKNQLETQKELSEQGLITNTQVVNTEQQIEISKNSIEQLKGQLVQISSKKLNLGFDLEQKININKQRIAETERRLKQLQDRYDLQTNIRSSYSGVVVELLTEAGVIVGKGTSLFKLKTQNQVPGVKDNLRGVLYISSKDGKKIKEEEEEEGREEKDKKGQLHRRHMIQTIISRRNFLK
jgi:HlyD family secretion protein